MRSKHERMQKKIGNEWTEIQEEHLLKEKNGRGFVTRQWMMMMTTAENLNMDTDHEKHDSNNQYRETEE